MIGSRRDEVVLKAVKRKNPSKVVAIKVMKKTPELIMKNLSDQIANLKELRENFLAHCYTLSEDSSYFYIITEYLPGGDLIDHLLQKKDFTEREAAEITESILTSLNYYHECKVIHQNIKPQNILFTSTKADSKPKLIDLGLGPKSESTLVSPHYSAPEVIEGNYLNESDIWSVGVVLYVMLSGLQPFAGDSKEEVLQSILKTQLDFSLPVWQKVTPPAKDLVKHLLQIKIDARIKPKEALGSAWFKLAKNYIPEINELDKSVIISIQKREGPAKFQKACVITLVNTFKAEEVNHLLDLLNIEDKEKSGYLSIDAIRKVFQVNYPTKEITNVVLHFSVDGQSLIYYSQFIASTLAIKEFVTLERQWAIFRYYNKAGADGINEKALKDILGIFEGKTYSPSDIASLLAKHKIDNPELISFRQFSEIMNKLKIIPEEQKLGLLFQ